MTRLLQDIFNEPDELTRSLAYTLGPGRAALEGAAALLSGDRPIVVTGIGSSWHAGMAVLTRFQEAGRPASLVDASELLHFARIPDRAVLLVLSRSGKSVEIVNLLPQAKRAGAAIVAITNTPDSSLAQAADVTLPLSAAFDHNVSVTMYSGLVLVGGLLAEAALGTLDGGLESTLGGALAACRDRMSAWQEEVETSAWLSPSEPTYFLARGASLATCHEARLLWEEAAKAPASALSTGGFRHGPQEMTMPGVRVGLWIDGERLRAEDLALSADLRQLGAQVMVVGQNLPRDAGDLVVLLPAIPAPWQPLIDVIPVQLAAERLARLRGMDCDSFRICPYIIEAEGGIGRQET